MRKQYPALGSFTNRQHLNEYNSDYNEHVSHGDTSKPMVENMGRRKKEVECRVQAWDYTFIEANKKKDRAKREAMQGKLRAKRSITSDPTPTSPIGECDDAKGSNNNDDESESELYEKTEIAIQKLIEIRNAELKEQEENIERSKIYLEILNKQAKVVDDLKCKQRKDAEVKYNLRIEEIERSEELMRELEEELERDIIYIKELDEEKEIDRKKRICIEEELVEYNIELREIEFVEEERRSKMEIQSKEYEKELKQEAKMKVIVKDSIERPPMAKRYHKAAHNEVVELKGNIRVFCRQRPPLLGEQILGSVPQEKPDEHFRILNDRHHIEVKLATERTLMGNTLANHPTVKRFQFDHIFKSYEGQESIFKEVGPFINCVLDGYNVCIFAYGQTGSGKTYTMEGGNDIYTPEQIGIIPRAVNLIFCQLNYQRAMGWEVELAASFIQIYCGIVKDLLNPGNQCADQTKLSKFIPKTEIVRTDKKILELMKMARGNRNVGKTLMNDESSRSHSIFKLELQGKNELTGDVIKSALNLIDLAGSERIALSQVVGQQMKETQYINKSLTNLKAVIHNLATNQPHVPFRNDKLTTILEPYLGGNCKTLMFVNISSYIAHKQETINSLQFALEANNTYLGNLDKEGGNPKAGKFIMKKM